MKAVVCLLVALLVVVAVAQKSFTAEIELTHPFMRGGFVRGTIDYSWDARAYRLIYPKTNYQEIYSFNSRRGYGTAAVTDKPFYDQWIYRTGRVCKCESGPVTNPMPAFFIDNSLYEYTDTGNTLTIEGRSCKEYAKKVSTTSPLKDYNVDLLYMDGATVCRAVFDDQNEITFKNVVVKTYTNAQFTEDPAIDNCLCGSPLDIVLVLDRSSSIGWEEFEQEKNFTVGFAKNFKYGPADAQLALVHFKKETWTTLKLSEGNTDQSVATAVDSLKCCLDDRGGNCCCCGTSVSGGIRRGADEMKAGMRNYAEHIMLVLTDGYANRDENGTPCGDNCHQNLRDNVAYAVRQVPDILIYAIGIGFDRSAAETEMLIIANGKKEHVFHYSNFEELASNSLELVARTCQDTIDPCGGCCGFCVCGQCVAPDACVSDSFCDVNAVSGVCCKEAPRDCSTADKCLEWTCDEAQKKCVSDDVPCKANSTCFNYLCASSTGTCTTVVQPGCEGQPECNHVTDCDDQNSCTKDECFDSFCKWTPLTCNDNNACTVDKCEVDLGCTNTPVPEDFCDDDSVCTTDSCVPEVGCVNTNITCSDDNPCTDDTCDPFQGCQSAPKVCPNDEECKIAFCEEGECGLREEDCADPAVVGVAAGLGTAAIVGIVIAVVVVVALIGGGGAFAYTQAAGNAPVAAVANNPLYVGSGAQGTNPLYANT